MDPVKQFTRNHVEIGDCFTQAARALRRLVDGAGRLADRIIELETSAEQLRACLMRQMEVERDFEPIVEHVLGCGLDEISDIGPHDEIVLKALEAYEARIAAARDAAVEGGDVDRRALVHAFDALVDAYEEHSELEQGFLESYTSVLFTSAGATY